MQPKECDSEELTGTELEQVCLQKNDNFEMLHQDVATPVTQGKTSQNIHYPSPSRPGRILKQFDNVSYQFDEVGLIVKWVSTSLNVSEAKF